MCWRQVKGPVGQTAQSSQQKVIRISWGTAQLATPPASHSNTPEQNPLPLPCPPPCSGGGARGQRHAGGCRGGGDGAAGGPQAA